MISATESIYLRSASKAVRIKKKNTERALLANGLSFSVPYGSASCSLSFLSSSSSSSYPFPYFPSSYCAHKSRVINPISPAVAVPSCPPELPSVLFYTFSSTIFLSRVCDAAKGEPLGRAKLCPKKKKVARCVAIHGMISFRAINCRKGGYISRH